MTDQLKSQRNELMSANHQLDERRRFTEAMLAGVSAGVVGVDPSGRIDLVNRSAMQLLRVQSDELIGKPITDAIVPFASLVDQASAKPSGTAEGQVSIKVSGEERSLFVRVTTEWSDHATHGFVVTFDDITELVSAQRNSAWADIARRIAHEIKNPLTPIQLSAEHLRRVHVDRGEPLGGVLDTCVTSILAQVRLLRQISAEFSSFASAPTARPSPVDVPTLIAEVVDPYRTGLSGRIEIVNQVAAPLPAVYVDRTLIARALSNIVENALHAMPRAGTLTIDAEATDSQVLVRVADTGVGMDDEALDRVFEPYFSTKTTGTGLGLPIARRNVEISGGTIEVASTKGVGTTVTMKLPMARE
jgi:two-component system nitrogen regulation sensor histidine kinase NtrY